MVLTAENYYSQKANEEYMSVSQFKDFCGTYGKMPCEFTAMEKLKGRWEEPKSKALMVGSYVDSYFEGTLYTFKKKNPDLFKRDGSLKAEFVKADEIIQRIERDSYFMKFMSGQKAFLAYSDDIGTEFEDMEDFPDKDSRESEIERTITDALLVHPATEYVRNFIFDYSSGDAVVSFIVKGAQWEEEETISTVFEKGVS